MTKIETLAERFVGPEPADFLDELWERTEADAVRRAKRWRVIAVALGLVAIAAIGAAAVLAARSGSAAAAGIKTVDRTLACGLKTDLGTGLRVFANVNQPALGANYPAQPGNVGTGAADFPLPGTGGAFAIASRLIRAWSPSGKYEPITTGYAFDDAVCEKTAAIPLAPSGVPRLGVFSRAGNEGLGLYCPYATAPLFVRMRVTVKNGVPKAAQLAVRVGRKKRPVAYIDWTPTRFTAHGSSGCLQQ